MARYVSLIRFTDQGARAAKKSAARALAFRKAAKKAGITVEAQLWTAVAQLVAQGNVRTETLRAFDAKEFKEIVG
jgi:uncharacterized protein with GYD domain